MQDRTVNEFEEIADLIEQNKRRLARQARRGRWMRWGWRFTLVGGVAAFILL